MSIEWVKGPAEASHAAVFGGGRGFLAFLAFQGAGLPQCVLQHFNDAWKQRVFL